MSKNRSYYSGKIHRNILVGELVSGKMLQEEMWLAGRVIGAYDQTIVLQDQSGRCELLLESQARIRFKENLVEVGDIIEAKVSIEKVGNEQNAEETIFKTLDLQLLVPCSTEFFIRTTDPNYRRMIVDQSRKEFLLLRSKIIKATRAFFEMKGFLEVETPIMVRLPGMEPYLDVFTTDFQDLNGQKERRFLITSPEYALKKLLVGGCEKIFEITKAFRNKETNSTRHNPEFSILEWYRAYEDYTDIMKDMEELFAFVAKQLFGDTLLHYGEKIIDLSPPWPRVKIIELFQTMAGIQQSIFEDEALFRKAVVDKGYKVNENSSFEDLFFLVFMNEIEPKLGFDKPVFIYDYPASMAALSRKCPDNSRYAQRFEAYMAGLELCNGFTELNDPVEQRKRLEAEQKERQHLGKLDYPVDDTFIAALELGMPPAGGTALGIDRMIMLFANTENIEDVVAFPWKDLGENS